MLDWVWDSDADPRPAKSLTELTISVAGVDPGAVLSEAVAAEGGGDEGRGRVWVPLAVPELIAAVTEIHARFGTGRGR